MKYTVKTIIEAYKTNPELKILPFWGHTVTPGKLTKACFSQWFDCVFEVDGVVYHTTEQYMMSSKARLFGDDEVGSMIMNASDPRDYKKLGRKIRGFDQKVWDANKYDIVVRGNVAKFSQNEELGNFLLSTGDAIIVEASPYDDIWGIKLGLEDARVNNPQLWQGENLLGCALMETRDILKEGNNPEM